METERETQTSSESKAFVLAMFNYVFPRRFDEEKIPRRFKTGKLQESEIHFNSDIGEAVLLICYLHGNSFLRRFLIEYPDYLTDIHTLVRYCRKYALELYDEENIFNSVLMFSAMFIEMVSYCSMPSVEGGIHFVNSADYCWSLIFASQFEKSFLASGGWKTLQEISQQKAQIYDRVKRNYPSYSNGDVPFHYWISDVDPETVETSVFEVGYCRIINWIRQIIQSDQLLKPLFQEILDSNAESKLEADTMQQQINVTGSDRISISQASDDFRGLSLQKNADLKSEEAIISDGVSDHVPTIMDVEDSNMERIETSETKSAELGAIPKTIPRSGEVWQTIGHIFDMEISRDKKDLIEKFKNKTFFANILDGIYIEKFFDDKEKTRILINHFSRYMKDTVNDTKIPDTKILVEEARSIITVATSAAALTNPSFQYQAPNISISSSEDLQQTFDAQNLQNAPEKDNLPLAGKSKFTAKMRSQQEDHLYVNISYGPKIDKKSSPRKVHRLKSEVHSNTTTMELLKKDIAAALSALSNKQLTQCETSERRKRLRSAIELKHIEQVFQHLKSELGITFSEDCTSYLDFLCAPYTRQGISVMMELMNVSHTLTDRILELLKVLPVYSLRMQIEKNVKELISKRTSIRIAMTILGHSSSAQFYEHQKSQYFAELIRVLICECAYFLQVKWNLKLVDGCLRDGKTCTAPQNSPVKEDVEQSSVSQSSADTKSDKRKRGKQLDVSPSKYKMVDTSTYSSGLAAADNSSSNPVFSTTHIRLPSDVAVTPVQMPDCRSFQENVKDSSDSDGNKH